MSSYRTLLLIAVPTLGASFSSTAGAQVPGKLLPIAPVPNKSLPTAGRVGRIFDSRGVQTVILRAGDAEQAAVEAVPGSRFITVSGIPEGGALGYHSPDPNWRETPASAWGLDFKAKSFGPTLVISSEKEISYIHHHYQLGGLMISAPPGVRVIKESRELTGDGRADLSPPAGR